MSKMSINYVLYLLLLTVLSLQVSLPGIAAANPPAFVQAIQSAKAGKVITIPAGEFAISSVKIPAGVKVQGSGVLASIVTILPGGAGFVFDRVQKAALSNLRIIDQANAAVLVDHSSEITLKRLLITGGVIGIKVAESTGVTLENCVASSSQVGISLLSSTKVGVVNNTLNANNTCGISMVNVTDCSVFNNLIIEAGVGTTLGGVNTRLAMDYNLYKALYVGGSGNQSRINVGAWTSLSGLDHHSVQFPVAFKNADAGNFYPTATLEWDPSRLTVSGWGMAKLQGVDAPREDLMGAKRTGIPDLGAVAVLAGPKLPYAGFFEVSSDDGRKSAGLFTPAGKVVRYLFQDLPLKKGRYGYVLPSYDQYGQKVVAGDYQVRVAEGQLEIKYLTLSANNGTNSDLQADSDSALQVAFSPTGDLLVIMGWGERALNVMSIDPSYTKKARWAFAGTADPIGVCNDGKMIYYAKNSGKNMVLTRLNPETGLPIPWSPDTPMLNISKTLLGNPKGLVYLDGRLYIADMTGNRLVSGDAAMPAFSDAVPATAPSSLTADVKNKLLWYVSKKESVVAVDSTGKTIATFTQVEHPVAVAVAGNRMAVAGAKTGKIYVYTIDNPQAPVLINTLGSGDGPFGEYSPTRFRFQEFRGVSTGCVLAMTADGMLALKDRFIGVFNADGKVVHSSFSQFGNALRRIRGTNDGKVHLVDQTGHLSWTDDPKDYTWQPGSLFYLPSTIKGCTGFFTVDGILFGVYGQEKMINEKDKQNGLAIVRFDKGIGSTVSFYTHSPTSKKFVVVHDENKDGVINEQDGDGTPLDPQPPFVQRRFMYVDADFSIRIMERFSDKLGYVMKFTGLDAELRPIYDTNPANSPLVKDTKYGSPYKPGEIIDMRFASESTFTPDGGMVLGTIDKFDPFGTGLSNSGCTNLAAYTKDGSLRWFLPINDYGPIQGIKSLGNFLLTSWGHQAEWIGLDPDGLQLGHFGYPEEADWTGYWLDHPDHYGAFENPDGSVSISAGDYMRNGQHWMQLTGARSYVKNAYPVTLTAQSFLPDAADGKMEASRILARSAQPRITIKKLAAPLVIDGDMTKWRTAGVMPQITILPHGGGIKDAVDCSAVVRLAYESNNLYVQVIRFDDHIVLDSPSGQTQCQDTTEMMINGFFDGFQFSVSNFRDSGDSIWRRRFYFGNLAKVLPSDHCPAKVTVYDSPQDIPERAMIEENYGVDLSKNKVLVMEYKLPIDDITYVGDTKALFPVASGKTVWIGFMIDDNDIPGTDGQRLMIWPANYSTFAGKEVSAFCTFE